MLKHIRASYSYSSVLKELFGHGTCTGRNFSPVRRINSTVAVALANPGYASREHRSPNDEDIAYFRSFIRSEGVVTDPDILQQHNRDWMGKYQGRSRLMLKPRTKEEVSKILAYCHSKKIPIVPQAGNTGLVGGSVPIGEEIILSTSSMNKILTFDNISGILTCEAGCILKSLDDYLAKEGYMMPIDLGAKGSCQIGGNVATNAGGLRLLRYGSLHGSVLGMEVVLADGTILDCMSTMRKDNTGYDLKQMFIGSEGTLGIITKLAILTPSRPKFTSVALLGCRSFENVLKAFVQAKQSLGEIVSAVEFMDRQSLNMVFKMQEWSKDPLQEKYPYYLLIETSGSNKNHDSEKLESYLEYVMEDGTVLDGTVAQDEKQAKELFGLREDITVALTSRGYVYKYDISIPIGDYYQIVEDVRERLKPFDAEIVAYGHLGDCNLHLNISCLKPSADVLDALEPYVFEWTSSKSGSISAEHGIGIHKPHFLHLSKSNSAIALMHQLKSLMDPHNILNPGKVLLTQANQK